MSRNRRAGHEWERTCVNILKKFFPFVKTTRAESRLRDAQGVDLINEDEINNGRLPYNFQCKTTTQNLNYVKLFDKMPKDVPPVLLHKYTEKANSKFIEKGRYVIMPFDEFIKLLNDKYESDTK